MRRCMEETSRAAGEIKPINDLLLGTRNARGVVFVIGVKMRRAESVFSLDSVPRWGLFLFIDLFIFLQRSTLVFASASVSCKERFVHLCRLFSYFLLMKCVVSLSVYPSLIFLLWLTTLSSPLPAFTSGVQPIKTVPPSVWWIRPVWWRGRRCVCVKYCVCSAFRVYQ